MSVVVGALSNVSLESEDWVVVVLSSRMIGNAMHVCDFTFKGCFFLTFCVIFCFLLLYSIDRPEALGIVPGAIFLICLTFCLVGYATSHPTKVRSHIICFLFHSFSIHAGGISC